MNIIAAKPRSERLDLTKGLLTLGMVFAHVIQFFGHGDSMVLFYFQYIANLVSFPGFMFCFGYAAWRAYLSKPDMPWLSVSKTALKCYAAYVFSGAAFRLLYSKEPMEWLLFRKIMTLKDFPGYSEFLLSFTFMIILAALFSPIFRKATERKLYLVFFCVAILALQPIPNLFFWVPTCLNGAMFTLYNGPFSIMMYAPFFVVGIYFSRHQVSIRLVSILVSLVLMAVFLALLMRQVEIQRFPPSYAWLFFAAPYVYVYFFLGTALSRLPVAWVKSYISTIGKHVLLYLLMSNIIIFTLKNTGIVQSPNYSSLPIPFAAIMLFVFLIQRLARPGQVKPLSHPTLHTSVTLQPT